MGMRKKDRAGPIRKCYWKVLNLDMFGEQLNFNVDGREKYNTCLGMLFTLAILFITVVYGYLTVVRAQREHEVPTILHQVREEHFKSGRDEYQVRQDSS